jgi:hypothetical protein
VTTVCARPFAVFVIVTETPGSAAPESSVTAPAMLAAPPTWARTGKLTRRIAPMQSRSGTMSLVRTSVRGVVIR